MEEPAPDGPPLDPAAVQTVLFDVTGAVRVIDVADAGLNPWPDVVTVPGAAHGQAGCAPEPRA